MSELEIKENKDISSTPTYDDPTYDVEKNQPAKSAKSKKEPSYDYDRKPAIATQTHVSALFCGDGCAYTISKWLYALLFVATAATAVGMKWAIPGYIHKMTSFGDCDTDICFGNQIVFRLSFSLAVFFLIMTVVTLIWKRFHFNLWFLKLFLLVGLCIMSFFIHNSFFDVYRDVSRVISILYLIIEVFLLINVAYNIHEKFASWMAENDRLDGDSYTATLEGDNRGMIQRNAKCIYLILSVLFLAGGITAAILLFVFYGDCSLHNGLIGVTLALGILSVIISSLEAVGKGILIPAVLFIYTMYNLFGSLDSNPDGTCNRFATRNNPLWMLIISISLTLLAVARSAAEAADDASVVFITPNTSKTDEEENTDDIELDDKQKQSEFSLEQTPNAMDHRVNHVYIYHIIMTFASCYLAMLLTGWGSENTPTQMNAPDRSKQSMWFKFGAICLTFVLYFWSLFAPLACKSRAFS